ncbi:MAG: pyridoxamine 5'-phosphate oxidase family protein [Desulfofustis sp.]|jgi:nitroimidazol reductase NimA-like FMN-containing flavoprotein (pyridoxamine 5'-phosphate oxidase superfamily)
MRKRHHEITSREKVEVILRRCRVGRIATHGADGYPYITPLNYVYHDDSIYFHCARSGEKLDNLKRDSRVCFEVDIPLAYLDLDYYGENPESCGVTQFYHSVVIRGRAEIVRDIDEKTAALEALVASHEPEGRTFRKITAATKAAGLCEVVAVRIERISGKSGLAQKKSDEEKNALSTFLENRGLPGDAETAALITGKEK